MLITDGVAVHGILNSIIDETFSDNSSSSLSSSSETRENRPTMTLIGSKFPDDQNDQYTYRMLNKVILCMETGVLLILKDLNQIYESLYDMFNQKYSIVGRKKNCRVSLGAQSNPMCHVHDQFRCILVYPSDKILRADPPFLNRFEKQRLFYSDILSETETIFHDELLKWMKEVARENEWLKLTFPIFTPNIIPSLIVSHRNRSKKDFGDEEIDEKTKLQCKKELLWTATQDSIARFYYCSTDGGAQETKIYWEEQVHEDLAEAFHFMNSMEENSNNGLKLFIMTHSSIHSTNVASCFEEYYRETKRMKTHHHHHQEPFKYPSNNSPLPPSSQRSSSRRHHHARDHQIRPQVIKLSQFSSEKELSTQIEKFWNDFNKKSSNLLIIQVDTLTDSEHLALTQFLIEEHKQTFINKLKRISEMKESSNNNNVEIPKVQSIKHVILMVHIDRESNKKNDNVNWQLDFLSGWKMLFLDSIQRPIIPTSFLLNAPSISSLVQKPISSTYRNLSQPTSELSTSSSSQSSTSGNSSMDEGDEENNFKKTTFQVLFSPSLRWCFNCIRYSARISRTSHLHQMCLSLSESELLIQVMQDLVFNYLTSEEEEERNNGITNGWIRKAITKDSHLWVNRTLNGSLISFIEQQIRVPMAKYLLVIEKYSASSSLIYYYQQISKTPSLGTPQMNSNESSEQENNIPYLSSGDASTFMEIWRKIIMSKEFVDLDRIPFPTGTNCYSSLSDKSYLFTLTSIDSQGGGPLIFPWSYYLFERYENQKNSWLQRLMIYNSRSQKPISKEYLSNEIESFKETLLSSDLLEQQILKDYFPKYFNYYFSDFSNIISTTYYSRSVSPNLIRWLFSKHQFHEMKHPLDLHIHWWMLHEEIMAETKLIMVHDQVLKQPNEFKQIAEEDLVSMDMDSNLIDPTITNSSPSSSSFSSESPFSTNVTKRLKELIIQNLCHSVLTPEIVSEKKLNDIDEIISSVILLSGKAMIQTIHSKTFQICKDLLTLLIIRYDFEKKYFIQFVSILQKHNYVITSSMNELLNLVYKEFPKNKFQSEELKNRALEKIPYMICVILERILTTDLQILDTVCRLYQSHCLYLSQSGYLLASRIIHQILTLSSLNSAFDLLSTNVHEFPACQILNKCLFNICNTQFRKYDNSSMVLFIDCIQRSFTFLPPMINPEELRKSVERVEFVKNNSNQQQDPFNRVPPLLFCASVAYIKYLIRGFSMTLGQLENNSIECIKGLNHFICQGEVQESTIQDYLRLTFLKELKGKNQTIDDMKQEEQKYIKIFPWYSKLPWFTGESSLDYSPLSIFYHKFDKELSLDCVTSFERLCITNEFQQLHLLLEKSSNHLILLRKVFLSLVIELMYFSQRTPNSTTSARVRHFKPWLIENKTTFKYLFSPMIYKAISLFSMNEIPFFQIIPNLPSNILMIISVFSHLMINALSYENSSVFSKFICQPNLVSKSFILTMEDDIGSIIMNSLQKLGVTKMYQCSCGEPYGIGNCGQAMVVAKCAKCGADIGGQSHRLVNQSHDKQGNALKGSEIIGLVHETVQKNEGHSPQREKSELSSINFRILHILTYLSMCGSIVIHDNISPLFQQIENELKIKDNKTKLLEYFFNHINEDWNILIKLLNLTPPVLCKYFHLILLNYEEIISISPNDGVCIKKEDRERFETECCRLFSKILSNQVTSLKINEQWQTNVQSIKDVLGAKKNIFEQELEENISLVQQNEKDRMSKDPQDHIYSLRVIFRTWSSPSIEHLKLRIKGDPSLQNQYPFLNLLVEWEERLLLVKHLKPLVDFTNEILETCSHRVSRQQATDHTIKEVISMFFEGQSKERLLKNFEIFKNSWNTVRKAVERFQCKDVQVQELNDSSKFGMVCISIENDFLMLFAIFETLATYQNTFLEYSETYLHGGDSEMFSPLDPKLRLCTSLNWMKGSVSLGKREVKSVQKIDAQDLINSEWSPRSLLYLSNQLGYGQGNEIIFDFASLEYYLSIQILEKPHRIWISTREDDVTLFVFKGETFQNCASILSDVSMIITQEPLSLTMIDILEQGSSQIDILSSLNSEIEMILSSIKRTRGDPSSSLEEYSSRWKTDSSSNSLTRSMGKRKSKSDKSGDLRQKIFSAFCLKHIVGLYEKNEEIISIGILNNCGTDFAAYNESIEGIEIFEEGDPALPTKDGEIKPLPENYSCLITALRRYLYRNAYPQILSWSVGTSDKSDKLMNEYLAQHLQPTSLWPKNGLQYIENLSSDDMWFMLRAKHAFSLYKVLYEKQKEIEEKIKKIEESRKAQTPSSFSGFSDARIEAMDIMSSQNINESGWGQSSFTNFDQSGIMHSGWGQDSQTNMDQSGSWGVHSSQNSFNQIGIQTGWGSQSSFGQSSNQYGGIGNQFNGSSFGMRNQFGHNNNSTFGGNQFGVSHNFNFNNNNNNNVFSQFGNNPDFS